MKSIYLNLANSIYKIKNTIEPNRDVITMKADNMSVLTNSLDNTARIKVHASNIKLASLETNEESYAAMVELLKTNKTTEITELPNTYKCEITYTIRKNNGEIFEHGTVFKDLTSVDKILMLGIDETNTMHYRIAKEFNKNIEMMIVHSIPYGIMKRSISHDLYTFTIDDISLYQDTLSVEDIHKSVYETAFVYTSTDTEQLKEEKLFIFSTKQEGILYEPVELPYLPKNINLNFTIQMGNYITVYDESMVQDVLDEIAESLKEPVVDPDDGSGEEEVPTNPDTGTEEPTTPAEGEGDEEPAKDDEVVDTTPSDPTPEPTSLTEETTE